MRTDFLHKTADGAAMAEVELTVAGAMSFKIAATDAAYLENTYSSSFVSEMAIQLTAEIESRMMISGLAKSDIALQLVFAPGTYMEHPQGEFTYRRLLISESGRAIKDLWIRWQRVGEGRNFTVCDDVAAGEIRFTLGEDVPQKVREKEYRFLVQADADKYRAAMGRKNVTEWREIIKRAVKRGTLTKITIDEKVAEHAGQIKDKLEEILGKLQPAPEAPQIALCEEKDEAYEKAMAYMRSFVQENTAAPAEAREDEEIFEQTEVEEEALEEAEASEEAEALSEAEDAPIEEDVVCAQAEIFDGEETEDAPFSQDVAEAAPEENEAFDFASEEMVAQAHLEEAFEEASLADTEETEEELLQEGFALEESVAPAVDMDALRAEMEKKLRAEMLEKEQELMRREYELERKRLALDAEIKAHELNRAEREIELRRQAQNQARLEWEAKERDRLAAQALEAIELRKEEEARLAEEARKAEEARLAEEARKAEEARAAMAANSPVDPIYTYTQKKVHLIFRHPVDPNVMTRIQQLMADTIRYFKKEHVFIKVKAAIPSEDTVDLSFTQFPVEEHQLLVDMIQVLGNSDLGICRVVVD